jgi:hypothetical protein
VAGALEQNILDHIPLCTYVYAIQTTYYIYNNIYIYYMYKYIYIHIEKSKELCYVVLD